MWESFCCGVLGCVRWRLRRRRLRAVDSEGGGGDPSGGGVWENGHISRSVQETVPPIVGDSRLRFDRDQHASTEELDGEERERVDRDSIPDNKELQLSESSFSAFTGSVATEDMEDDGSSDCDCLLPYQVGQSQTVSSRPLQNGVIRTEAESSKESLVVPPARANRHHAHTSNAANTRTGILKKLFSRQQPSSLVTAHSTDSGIDAEDTVSPQPNGSAVLVTVVEESDAEAATSDRTQLVVPHLNRGYLDGIRKGKRSAPVVTHPRMPFNLLKKPAKATPDVV